MAKVRAAFATVISHNPPVARLWLEMVEKAVEQDLPQ
jgi:hypothetical protein